MPVETFTALAATFGGAVVQAAGTEAWAGLRPRVARLFGRGDIERELTEFARLDRTAQALEPGAAADTDRERLRQEGVWQERFETLMNSLGTVERELVAQELGELIAFVAAGTAGDTAIKTGKATARDGGTAVTGIKRAPGPGSFPAKAEGTGDAEALGPGSSAVSGIVHG